MNTGRRRGPTRGVRALLVLLVSAPLALAGCAPAGLDLGGSLRARSPVWLSDGWIYFIGNGADDSEATGYLWRVKPDGRAEPANMDPAVCESGQDLVDLFPIGDRELGTGIECLENRYAVALFRLDPATGTPTELTSALDGVVDAAWSAARSEGYASTWSGAGSTGYGGPVRCRLGLVRLARDRTECVLTIPSRSPAFPPTGARLFFLGSGCAGSGTPETAGDARWRLCSWNLDANDPVAVGGRFADPSGLAVNPGTTRAAVTDTTGLWLVDLATGRTTKVEEGTFSRATFSPDGRQIAVGTWADGALGATAGLRVLDVTEP
jgi:hypothetical protein